MNLEDAAKFVKKLKETDPDIVNRSGSEDDHRMLHGGLIYLALTEPETRRTCLHDILLTSRDNLNYALSELTRLVAEAWPKMLQPVRKSMLAILAELIATRGANVDILVLHVFRRMPSGDLSSLNLWLIQSVLDLLIRNREWLEHEDRKPFLLPLAVYTFLRLIPDHLNGSPSSSSKGFDPAVSSTIATLFQRESNFVVETLRKDFDRCASIGRDLIRLLHPLSRTEPFQRLWNDIFNNISSLSNIHTSVNSVLDIATPQYFAQTLIPQDMEVWIRWMLRNVHCASGFPVRRYQEFFHKKFFSTQESLNLRVCLVRYIVNSFYPDNDMLASSLIPRWNVISWLISQCTCQTTCQSMKLALFFDWFFFKPNECIMNVEPAILAIANNLSSRFQPFGLVLVEYLTKTAANFCPALTERIAMSVRSGLEDMLRLGVIRSISPFLDILLRASPEIYRNFSSLIGPLVDSTLPIPSAIGPGCGSASTPIPVANEVGGGSGGGSTDGNKFHHPRPHLGPSNIHTSPDLFNKAKRGDALAHSSALNLSAVNPSATGPPTDPRLRRHTLTSSTPKNGGPHSPPVLPPKPRPRSPSPDGCGRFSPPPIPYVDLSSSGVLSSADTKSQTPSTKPQKQSESKLQSSPLPSAVSPSVTPIREKLSALPNNFESFASPEYRIGPNSSGDSVQQRIDDLRRKFQFYQLRYLYKMKTDVDVNGLIGQFDGQIREDLENLASAAKAAGIFREAEAVIEETPASTPNSSSTDDAGKLPTDCVFCPGLIDSVLDDDFPDDLAVAGRIADIVCQLCLPLFDAAGGDWGSNGVANHRALATLLPSHLPITQEQIDASLASPVFVPLRNLCEMSRGNNKREILLLLLTEIQIRQPRIGYHLLYFLAVRLVVHLLFVLFFIPENPLYILIEAKLAGTVNDEKMMAYRSFCASQENPNVVACLQRDMQLLADDNRFLFCYLLPTVWSVFSNDLANNTDFIRLIVGKIDPSQANYLVCEILRGHLNFFHRPNITDVLKASLDWTSMEQFFFWQLVNAHELPTKTFLPLISLVDGQKHPEACSHLLLLLQLEKLGCKSVVLVNEGCVITFFVKRPTNEVVRLLLSRGISNLNSTATSSTTDDLLSVTALHYWGCPGRLNAQRFAEILGSMINATVSGLRAAHDGEESASAAKKRNGVKSGSGLEHLSLLVSILTHLDCMRRKCRNIARKKAGICWVSYHLSIPSICNACHALFVSACLSVLEAAEIQSSLQQVIHSAGVPTHVKDRFADLLSLVEDDSIDVQQTTTTTRAGGVTRSSRQDASDLVGGGSSKGGHSLRNLDSRRAAEAERRRSAVTSSNMRRKPRRKSDEDGEDSGSNSSSDEDVGSDGVLAFDDSLDPAVDDEEQEDGERVSSTPDDSDENSSESVIDDDEEPVSRGKKRPARGRTTANKKQSQVSLKKKGPSKSRKTVVIVESDEDGEESEPEDTPRVTGAPKRRKMVSRRLLDD
ncbi:unnamed protein product [Mesocestoides corti]|uniref:SOSS complex subunit A homolog n=1 Tax=Mesocestoides corti TaxID=53468 RepID=A0A158QUH9_MESCO|nr:unnamed protein product [Mesocestoides corti]